jgi:hypothetical protein
MKIPNQFNSLKKVHFFYNYKTTVQKYLEQSRVTPRGDLC